MAIRPPKDQSEAVLALARFDDAGFKALRSIVDEEKPTAEPAHVRSRIAVQFSNSGFTEARALMTALSGMYHALARLDQDRAKAGGDRQDFFEQVLDGVGEVLNKPLTAEERTAALGRLGALLGPNTAIARTFKVHDILITHQRVYAKSRVLTDVRPIFPDVTEEPFSEAVTVHTLKIDYLEEGEEREFFVALDNLDLDDLRAVIDKAEKKRRSVELRMSSAGVAIYQPEKD